MVYVFVVVAISAGSVLPIVIKCIADYFWGLRK